MTRPLRPLLCLSIAFALAACDDDGGGSASDTTVATDATTATGSDATTSTTADATTSTATDAATSDDAATTSTDATSTSADTSASDMANDFGDDVVDPPTGCWPVPFDEGATYADTIAVATDGNDQSGNGSAAAPYATLERAVQDAAPGTEIVMAAGTYAIGSTWFLSGLEGTGNAPIRIRGEGTVVLDASGSPEALHLIEPRWVVLENFTVTGSSVNGINIDDGGTIDTPAHHVVLRDLVVRDVGTGGNNDCVKLSGLDDFFVLDSEFTNCNAGNSVDMVGCHDGLIAGNHFHDTASGIQAKGGSSGTLIAGNRFVDVPGRGINAGGSTGLEFFRPIDAPYEAADLRIVGNVFVRGGSESGAAVAFVGCDGCVFAHNTLIEPRTWIARILQETVDPDRFVPSRDGWFANNIVVFRESDLRNGTYVNVGGNTAPETFTFSSNLWWELDDPTFSGPGYSGGIPAETDAIVGLDPMLGADWVTPSGSPAVGAATAMPPFGPHGDFTGRCFESPASVGAWEP